MLGQFTKLALQCAHNANEHYEAAKGFFIKWQKQSQELQIYRSLDRMKNIRVHTCIYFILLISWTLLSTNLTTPLAQSFFNTNEGKTGYWFAFIVTAIFFFLVQFGLTWISNRYWNASRPSIITLKTELQQLTMKKGMHTFIYDDIAMAARGKKLLGWFFAAFFLVIEVGLGGLRNYLINAKTQWFTMDTPDDFTHILLPAIMVAVLLYFGRFKEETFRLVSNKTQCSRTFKKVLFHVQLCINQGIKCQDAVFKSSNSFEDLYKNKSVAVCIHRVQEKDPSVLEDYFDNLRSFSVSVKICHDGMNVSYVFGNALTGDKNDVMFQTDQNGYARIEWKGSAPFIEVIRIKGMHFNEKRFEDGKEYVIDIVRYSEQLIIQPIQKSILHLPPD